MDAINTGGITDHEWINRMILEIIEETEWEELSKLLPKNSRHKVQVERLIKQLNRLA